MATPPRGVAYEKLFTETDECGMYNGSKPEK
jgi:hypothetical protein